MSIQELKEKEKEERRNYIVDAAEKLFFSKGYDNVSMKDIADEVDISRASLYLYFKNKESVYFSIVLRAKKVMNRLFEEWGDGKKNGLERLRAMGRAYFKFYNDFNDYYNACVYFHSQRFDKSDEEYVPEIMELFDRTVQIMCESVEEGIKDGSIRDDLNPLEVAIFISTTSKQVINLSSRNIKALESQGISYEQYIEDSLNLWTQMIINKV